MAGSIKDLSLYRFNRSYYSVFHAMRAVNVLDEYDSSKHSGVIAHFNQFHVKEGNFPKEASKIIKSLSEMREHADYEDFFVASRQDAEEQIIKAERFLQLTREYLITQEIL